MVKNNQLLSLFVFTMYLFSFNTGENKPKEGVRKGNELPITFFEIDEIPELDKQLANRMVFVEFWRSGDVALRFNASAKSDVYGQFRNTIFANGRGFTILSLNYDKSEAVYQTLLQKEAMVWPYHAHISEEQLSQFLNRYNDGKNIANALIDGSGRVLDTNLNLDQLEARLNDFSL